MAGAYTLRARSLGLGFGQTLRHVVMPQALRMVVPPIINVFIALTKNTSVAGVFGVLECAVRDRRGQRAEVVLHLGAVRADLLLGRLGRALVAAAGSQQEAEGEGGGGGGGGESHGGRR